MDDNIAGQEVADDCDRYASSRCAAAEISIGSSHYFRGQSNDQMDAPSCGYAANNRTDEYESESSVSQRQYPADRSANNNAEASTAPDQQQIARVTGEQNVSVNKTNTETR